MSILNPFLLCGQSSLDDFLQDSHTLSISTLPIVFGWYQNNSKWIVKEKEIKNTDKFSNFYIISFYNNRKKWVALIKEEKENKTVLYNTYVTDYSTYEKLIKRWDEDAILNFPIYKHFQVRVNKKDKIDLQVLTTDNPFDIIQYPHDFFVFQFKFFKDSTVKFLFYLNHCDDSCFISGFNNQKDQSLNKMIGTNDIYDTFFYKTTAEYFIDFIDSPLKN